MSKAVTELTVEYRETCFKKDSTEVESYRFEAYVPGCPYTDFDLWVTPDGKELSSSGTFQNLEKTVQNELILLAAELIKKL